MLCVRNYNIVLIPPSRIKKKKKQHNDFRKTNKATS